MSRLESVSGRILNEIASQTRNKAVRHLATEILRFEMENWKKERVHFTEHFEQLISQACPEDQRRDDSS